MVSFGRLYPGTMGHGRQQISLLSVASPQHSPLHQPKVGKCWKYFQKWLPILFQNFNLMWRSVYKIILICCGEPSWWMFCETPMQVIHFLVQAFFWYLVAENCREWILYFSKHGRPMIFHQRGLAWVSPPKRPWSLSQDVRNADKQSRSSFPLSSPSYWLFNTNIMLHWSVILQHHPIQAEWTGIEFDPKKSTSMLIGSGCVGDLCGEESQQKPITFDCCQWVSDTLRCQKV